MTFKEWVDSKIIHVEDIYSVDDDQTFYICTNLKILNKVYQAFKHTNSMKYIKLYYIESEKDYPYCIASEISMNDIYHLVSYLNRHDSHMAMTLDSFKRSIGNLAIRDNNEYFYCLFTVDPRRYGSGYTRKIEKILNKYLDNYTTVTKLYEQFSDLVKNNDYFQYVIESHEEFGIKIFNTEEDYLDYMQRLDTLDEMSDYIETLDIESMDDEEFNVINDMISTKISKVDKTKLN